MRLPHQFLENIALSAGSHKELIAGLGASCTSAEKDEILRLSELGLPPVTSIEALAVASGFNPGFLWSLIHKPEKHYRIFMIPKGRDRRQIEAPRVGLKFIQKWLSAHFERTWVAHEAVHGFVKGRSHITAAQSHLGANWIVSVDIENFFPSTDRSSVISSLERLGYQTEESIFTISRLLCFQGRLSQGAPSSPIISNIALDPIDHRISEVATRIGARYTRYADDVVLSGTNDLPPQVIEQIEQCFGETRWRLSAHKRHLAQLPERLKVHGLLVHGNKLRLTKGYRNRIRAFSHLLTHGRVKQDDINRLKGHLNYAGQIDRAGES